MLQGRVDYKLNRARRVLESGDRRFGVTAPEPPLTYDDGGESGGDSSTEDGSVPVTTGGMTVPVVRKVPCLVGNDTKRDGVYW